MKSRNSIRRILCTLVCLCLAAVLALGMMSCNKEEGPKEGEVAVVRLLADLKKGEQITEDKVEIDYILEENVPINAIRELEKVVGKYLTTDVFTGEFLFAAKLVASEGENAYTPLDEPYISVASYVERGSDVTEKLQKLINDNPGRTLYFADGLYVISKPLVISADPQKAVSLNLSNYATIKAADSWSGDSAMIRFGGADNSASAGSTANFLLGGIIDANGKATAVSVEGGRDTYISQVSIKNAEIGLYIADAESGAVNVDVDNTNIAGTFKDSAIGVMLEGNGNTFSNVRINGCGVAMDIIGVDNTLRNVFAVYSGSAGSSIAFKDDGPANDYDMCQSENYATAFWAGKGTHSTYSGCYAYWTSDIDTQTAFATEGAFNLVVRTCKADFVSDSAASVFVDVGATGGKGQIIFPMIKGVENLTNKDYEAYLNGTTVLKND